MGELKVYTGSYLSGAPANDEYDIRVAKGIAITLTKEAFNELASAITDKASNDLSAMQAVADRYNKTVQETRGFIKEITEVFYDVGDDWAVRYSKQEIDFKKLDDVLDKYRGLLGFE